MWIRTKGISSENECILLFQDITEHVETHEKLLVKSLEHETALRDRVNYFARLSHELKTPLNAIMGMSDAILFQNSGAPMTQKVELIKSSAIDLLKILDETLDYAKLQSNEHVLNQKAENIHKLIQKTCNLWEYQALKNGTEISFDIDETIPELIQLDALKLRQCLNNLLSNAIKFTECGTIKLSVRAYRKPNKPDRLAIIVKDNGIGMNEEQKSLVFQAYKQADETISSRFGGTGLGMNITKNLVELMGGKINLKSAPNQGTAFLVLLPLISVENTPDDLSGAVQQSLTEADHKENAIHISSRDAQDSQPSAINNIDKVHKAKNYDPVILKDRVFDLSRMNALIVDDNETNHFVLSSLFEGSIGQIYTAYNGKEALDILKTENIDFVLMDIHMPVMDGIEATIAIRQSQEAWSDIKIIAVTADPQYQQKRMCLNIGMNATLAKPIKFVDLIDTIRQVMTDDSEETPYLLQTAS